MLDLAGLAARHGDRPALEARGAAVGYAELAVRAEEARAAWRARGFAAGERAALVCEPTPGAVADVLALLSLGGGLLPVDPAATASELGRYAEAFGAAWQGRAGGAVARTAGVAIAAPDTGADAPALAFLSSGSSGSPKLVQRTREQEAAGRALFARAMETSPEDRVLGLLSLGHSYGFNRVLLGSLAVGACVVLPDAFHPRAVTERIVASRVTSFAAPPSMLDLMARFQRGAPRPLTTLRHAVAVGQALPRRTWRAFAETFGIAPWSNYGASEAGAIALNRTGASAGEILALGEPLEGVTVALLDEQRAPVADGEPGEIVVRSPAVALGYLGGEAGGSRIEDGRFFSGDLAVRRDGVLHFAGRKKLLIAVAGRKVSPEEVEAVLCRHPAIADAAALARVGEGGVKALVVARGAVSAAELMAFCRASLAAHKVPREVEFRQSLPRGALGKLQRDRLA